MHIDCSESRVRGSSRWLPLDTSAGADSNRRAKPSISTGSVSPSWPMDAVRCRARIHASRANFELASEDSVTGPELRTVPRLCAAFELHCRQSHHEKCAGYEARNDRNSRRFRLRPGDQGRSRADLPDGRVLLRQRRARRRAVQSRSAGIPLQPDQQPHLRCARAARHRARRRRRQHQREFGADGAVLRGAERHGNGPQHRLGAAALRHHLHSLRPHPAEDGRTGALREIRPRRRSRGLDRRRYPRDVLRDRRQSGRQCVRPRSARRGCSSPPHAADSRQHRRDADAGAARRLRRGRRHSFIDEIHGRPWNHARRHRRGLRHLLVDRQCGALPHVHAAR